LWNAGERSIHATKQIENLPSTIFMGDEYKDDKDPHSKFKKFEQKQINGKNDFDLNFTKVPLLAYEPKSSKVFI